jgi:hypothetical protein
LFPYIWDEVRLHIGYDSDLDFVAQTMGAVATRHIGPSMAERVGQFRQILAHTAVNELDVQEAPVVIFRAHPNTWIEAIVRYLVDPHDAGPTKTALLKELLAALNEQPDRVRFPKGNAR